MIIFSDPKEVFAKYAKMDNRHLIKERNRIIKSLKAYEKASDEWIEDADILYAWDLRDLMFVSFFQASKIDSFGEKQYAEGLSALNDCMKEFNDLLN